MDIGVSTRWNATLVSTKEDLIRPYIECGIKAVELSYDLDADQIEYFLDAAKEKVLKILSVHAYCPRINFGVFSDEIELSSLSQMGRSIAVDRIRDNIRLARRVGAKAIVVHAGHVDMRNITCKLIEMAKKGEMFSSRYHKLKMHLIEEREKKSGLYLASLKKSISELEDDLKDAGVVLCLENMPLWEYIPTGEEMERLLGEFPCDVLGYWHDTGHGQIFEMLGLASHERWFERLSKRVIGIHIHDITAEFKDHLAPGEGCIDFSIFKKHVGPDTVLVFEPFTGMESHSLLAGISYIERVWGVKL